MRDEVRQASSVNKEIAETISGAGIRISPYSLFQLHRAPESAAFEAFKYNAYGLTLEGMAEVLEVTTDVISELHQFQYFGGRGNLDEIISKLPVDVANRVRQRISFARR